MDIAELADLVERNRLRAHRHARGHYLAGKQNEAMHVRLGIPAVVLSTVVGSAIFATISSSPSTWLVVATGLASLTAAVLAALQTFFGYPERASKHRLAGAEFSALKRDLDVLKVKLELNTPDPAQALEEIAAITDRFSKLERESPDIPDHFYDRARREQSEDTEGV